MTTERVYLDAIKLELSLAVPLLDVDGNEILDVDSAVIYTGGNEFVDVTADVTESLTCAEGISGASPSLRVASPLFMDFRLKNSESNSAGTRGYYSPKHANTALGFGKNSEVRFSFQGNFGQSTLLDTDFEPILDVDGANILVAGASDTYYAWRGRVSTIEPAPGIYGPRTTKITATDYMKELERFPKAYLLAVQTDKTAAQAYQAVLDAMSNQPASTEFSSQGGTMGYVFDTAQSDRPKARDEFVKIARSLGDYVWVECDASGGVLVKSQNVKDRINTVIASGSINNSMKKDSFKPVLDREDKYNQVLITARSREVGTATEVIFTLNSPLQINAGESITIDSARYTDPNNRSVKVAAQDVHTTFTASTDYKFGSGEGDDSEDLNSDLNISVTAYSLSAKIMFTNNGASTGYVNFFQLEADTVIRIYDALTFAYPENPASQDFVLDVDLPYADPKNTSTLGNIYKSHYVDEDNEYKLQQLTVDTSKCFANMNLAFLGIGSRITVIEDQSGVNDDYFINFKQYQWIPPNFLRLTIEAERNWDGQSAFA